MNISLIVQEFQIFDMSTDEAGHSTPNKKASGCNSDSKIIQYVSCVVIISMVIGNMFFYHRMDSIMKSKSYISQFLKFDAKSSIFKTAKDQSVPKTENITEEAVKKVPLKVAQSLKCLGLDPREVHNIASIKTAYHMKALKYHPDVLPMGSEPREKKSYQRKFQELTQSYNECLQFYKE